MDWMPLRMFDEGRNAVNAVEMMKSGDFIITRFEGISDFFNTKPPLLFWCQVIFLKLFGVSDIAIRFPVALFALATCMYLYWFSKKYLNNEVIGFISILILMTSLGYVNYHGSRSGDFDTLLTFFLLVNACSFFLYLETRSNNHLYLFMASWILSCYSKGIVGMMFLPAYLIYTLWTRNFSIFKVKKIYGLGILSCGVILSYYFIRDIYDPGYLDAVNKADLSGRYFEVIDGHKHPWYFYIQHIYQYKFFPWIFFLLFSIFYFNFSKLDIVSRFIKFAFLTCFLFLIFISLANTKLIWYDMPMYPLMAIMSACGVYELYERIKVESPRRAIVFLVLIFISPYYTVFKTIYIPRVASDETSIYFFSNYVKDHQNKLLKYSNLNIQWHGYHSSNLFYVYQLQSLDKSVKYNQPVRKGDHLVAYQKDVIEFLKKTHAVQFIQEHNGVTILKVL